MASADTMIEADGLTKDFGAFTAVRDASFRVKAGEVVAFVGPNGAGKSTTMRMLTGYLAPTAGTARVAGVDVARDRIAAARKIGYLPENGPLYDDMTPRSMLNFFARTRDMAAGQQRKRCAEVIELCGLTDVANKRISKLSRGYRQRVGLANALLHEPDVLILDEPTSGLDPNQTQHVRATLKQIGRRKTILLSTHLLQEVQAMATRVLMIARGQMVFDGTPKQLKEKGGQAGLDGAFRLLTDPDAQAQESRHR